MNKSLTTWDSKFIILSHAKVNNSLFQSPIFFSRFLKIVELHKILHVFLCTLILASEIGIFLTQASRLGKRD